MKRHYSNFVRHCLRKYVATLEIGTAPKFNSEIEKANWLSCHSVVSALSADNQRLVLNLYGPGDTIPDKIYHIAQARKMSQAPLWKLVDDVEYKIAKKRGLV